MLVDKTINGKCSKCGNCCSSIIPLSNEEVKNIKKIVKEKNIKPVHHIKEKTNETKEASIDFMCPFLNENNECNIYENRPSMCREFMCNKNEKDMVLSLLENIDNSSKKNIKDILETRTNKNMAQEIFPKEFEPKTNDFVVINAKAKKLFEEYQNVIFKTTGGKQKKKKKTYLYIKAPEHRKDIKPMWVDITCLTKVDIY